MVAHITQKFSLTDYVNILNTLESNSLPHICNTGCGDRDMSMAGSSCAVRFRKTTVISFYTVLQSCLPIFLPS